jgi:hypothetical protein
MGTKCRKKKNALNISKTKTVPTRPIASSLLDVMEDGIEFASLCKYSYDNIDIYAELRRSISEIEAARHRTAICYFANFSAFGNGIDGTDDVPFNEMVNAVPADVTEIDVLLVTPGGSGEQVAIFVQTLRNRFTNVNFIIIDKAMSAGTIFIMSGDEIVMSKESRFGPIDPQIFLNGRFVPAQSILISLNEIQRRGQIKIQNGGQPDWTDIQLLRQFNHYDIGSALVLSDFSIKLVQQYLNDYKFRDWTAHRESGRPVTQEERKEKAETIAKKLCDHSIWKSHGYAINRDEAWNECQLEIVHAEAIPGLDRAMRRMRALLFWMADHMNYSKLYISQNYCLLKGNKH